MLIVKQTTRNDSDGYSTVWNLSEDQMNFLLTFAINTLIGQGLAKIEEQLPDDEAQAQLDLLHDLDPEELGAKQ
jgi:phage portal protein BeeE